MIRLLIKTHNVTGLKYLCKCTTDGYLTYTGSGTRWLNHLKVHGKNLSTQILFECDDKELFSIVAGEYSRKLDVVRSQDFANLIPETGDGGPTIKGKIRITDGTKEKYVGAICDIPSGWRRGRADNNPWKNKEKQRELSDRQDRTTEKYRLSRKEAGRKTKEVFKLKPPVGMPGDLNPAKRPEVRNRIGFMNSRPVTFEGVHYNSISEAIRKTGLTEYMLKKRAYNVGCFNRSS